MKKICSVQANIVVESQKPRFKYEFKEAGNPVEVKEDHVKKILLNPDFYEAGKKSKGGK